MRVVVGAIVVYLVWQIWERKKADAERKKNATKGHGRGGDEDDNEEEDD